MRTITVELTEAQLAALVEACRDAADAADDPYNYDADDLARIDARMKGLRALGDWLGRHSKA